MSKSKSEKFCDYFGQALFSNMNDIKDIVKKNLNVEFDYVLGQQKF